MPPSGKRIGNRIDKKNAKLYDLLDSKDPGSIYDEIIVILNILEAGSLESRFRPVYRDIVRLFDGDYPGYRASNTRYHNLEHTLLVTLAAARLPAAAERAQQQARRSATAAEKGPVQDIPIRAENGQAQPAEEAIAELLGQLRAAQDNPEPHRCQAMTKSGARCRNRRRAGSKYCHLHQSLEERRDEGKKG